MGCLYLFYKLTGCCCLQRVETGWTMKPDQQRVCDVVMETVMGLCASGLEGSVARVQGVIGVTVDNSDVFLIHINDTVRSLAAAVRHSQHSGTVSDTVHSLAAVRHCDDVAASTPAALQHSDEVASCRSSVSPERKRARHRLMFNESESAAGVATIRRSGDPLLVHTAAGTSGVGSQVSYSAHAVNHCVSTVTQQQQSEDMNLLPTSAESDSEELSAAVVVVDSEDEDVKLVTHNAGSRQAVSTAAARAVCKDKQPPVVQHAAAGAHAVSNLCIANVVGSVSRAVFKQDDGLDPHQTDKDNNNDCVVTEPAHNRARQLLTARANATAAACRKFQVTFGHLLTVLYESGFILLSSAVFNCHSCRSNTLFCCMVSVIFVLYSKTRVAR